MIYADLHVHSKASKRPSEWFLKKVGARESYTQIDTLYANAKEKGMNFITITDHNTLEGGLELNEKYPDDTFLSVEATTYFPENNCKIHVLLYDITPEIFSMVEELRCNIYLLRDFIKENNLAYSVAHGFYSINNKLNLKNLEKLILLFDVFEGFNGARNRYYNEIWQEILKNLTPAKIEMLQKKYKIEPISQDPWLKGFTGGSDDHAGLFIGQTCTSSDCGCSKEDFINSIKNKKTESMGRCNDYKSFAFSIYKIFCDYSSVARKNAPGGIMDFVNHVVFEDNQSRLKKWFTLKKVKKGNQIKDKIILNFFEDVYALSHNKNLDIEEKIESIYKSMGLLLNEFFKVLLDSFVNDFAKGDIGKLFRNLMSSFPAFFISIPFFSSLRHLSQDRDLMLELKEKYIGKEGIIEKKVLWFTDTLNDLNGVSITLEKFRQETIKRKLNLFFVTCGQEKPKSRSDTSHIINLPSIYSITPEFYSTCTLNFPSLLESMDLIYKYRPDRIIVSTPGPVGMIGLAMGMTLGIECVSIYHTDFSAQSEYIFKDEALAGFIQSGINRFYSFSSQIKVPTQEYINILEQQSYKKEKMSLFKRGFTSEVLNPSSPWKKTFRKEKGILDSTTILWAGRVSKDKNINFLIEIYKKALEIIPDLNLVLCGHGPDLAYYKKEYRSYEKIHFEGYIYHKGLQHYYEMADLFVFPSTTDTFGMVILEAQARGLFSLVTDVGGPQEIIEDGVTGNVLGLSNPDSWVRKIVEIHKLKTERAYDFNALRKKIHKQTITKYSWENAIYDIMGGSDSSREEILSEHLGSSFEEKSVKKNSSRQLERKVA